MKRRFLVTGTDTGVGKTTVTCAVAAALARRGSRVGVVKPAETGCEEIAGQLFPADAALLKFFSGCDSSLENICPYRARAPLAPAIALAREGIRLRLESVVASTNRLADSYDLTLVEGAGGLLVPLAGSATFADLARQCGLSLVVVVGNRLGALNHARLTIDWACFNDLEVTGYIVNQLAPASDLAAETNIETLERLLGRSMGVLPWLGRIECSTADRARLADEAERSLDLTPFLADI